MTICLHPWEVTAALAGRLAWCWVWPVERAERTQLRKEPES